MKKVDNKTDGYLKMKLYNIRELTQFGIGEKELYRWVRNKWLKPFTYSGSLPKYRYEDFYKACELNMQDIRQRTEKMVMVQKPAPSRSKKDEVMARLKATYLS